MTERRYADPTALRQAITDRLRAWVLKGAAALLARLGGVARHTLDVDLFRPDARLDEAETAAGA